MAIFQIGQLNCSWQSGLRREFWICTYKLVAARVYCCVFKEITFVGSNFFENASWKSVSQLSLYMYLYEFYVLQVTIRAGYSIQKWLKLRYKLITWT